MAGSVTGEGVLLPSLLLYSQGNAIFPPGQQGSVCVCVCVCVRARACVWGDVRVWCLSSLAGGLQTSSAAPTVIADRCAYTHVPPASCPSYITHPVQQRKRGKATPTLLAQTVRGEKVGQCSRVLSFRDVAPSREKAEETEGFVQCLISSLSLPLETSKLKSTAGTSPL